MRDTRAGSAGRAEQGRSEALGRVDESVRTLEVALCKVEEALGSIDMVLSHAKPVLGGIETVLRNIEALLGIWAALGEYEKKSRNESKEDFRRN
ncbi:MAG: hypothetical protein V2A73_17575 [Pseudomonadota bacterium]